MSASKDPLHCNQGFTILELVITISLIGILLPTVIMFLHSINAMNGKANTISTINAYAENKIEGYRSVGFVAVPLTASPVEYTGVDALPSTLPKPHSATYSVTLAEPSNPALKKIELNITYQSLNGLETKTYVTYLGELGVGQY